MPAGGHGHHAGGAVAPGLNLPPAAGTGRYGESMKPYLLGGLAAVLMGTAIIASAAPASAGCINARLLLFPTAQKCDAPPAPDGRGTPGGPAGRRVVGRLRLLRLRRGRSGSRMAGDRRPAAGLLGGHRPPSRHRRPRHSRADRRRGRQRGRARPGRRQAAAPTPARSPEGGTTATGWLALSRGWLLLYHGKYLTQPETVILPCRITRRLL